MSTALQEEHVTEHVELDSRQDALERRVLLLAPSIGWWRGMYQLPRRLTETVSDGRSVNKDDITVPRAKLITEKYPVDRQGKAWKKRFQAIESRLMSLKERYSVPFPIQGVRIVPKSVGQIMMDEMYGLTIGRLRQRIARLREDGNYTDAATFEQHLRNAIRIEGEDAHPNTPVFDPSKSDGAQSIAYDLHIAAREFCNDWDNIREQIKRNNDVFELVESRVPTSAGLMRSKFSLDVVPVELAGGISGNCVTQDDLAEHSAIVREACRRRVEEAIESMIEGPRAQLSDALSNLQELIARDGRITSRSFTAVRDAIAKIRMFDFAASPEMLNRMTELERQINTTIPNELDRVTAANNGFSAALDQFRREIEDAQTQARDVEEFGKTFRAIDF